MATREQQISALQKDWETNPRWKGVQRAYTADDVVRLRGSVQIEHTLARRGAEKLWDLVNNEDYVNALGALTGNQAMQQVKAGLKAIYLSGWQAKCIPTSRCTRPTRCQWWSAASTTPSSAPIRSSGPKARMTSISSRPSWPTPRPASAACSTRSS
jgi:hypothetical protein